MDLIYVHYDGLTPKKVTKEEAIDLLASSVTGIADPTKYAAVVLSDPTVCANSSFGLYDSGEMLLVVS